MGKVVCSLGRLGEGLIAVTVVSALAWTGSQEVNAESIGRFVDYMTYVDNVINKAIEAFKFTSEITESVWAASLLGESNYEIVGGCWETSK